MTPKNLPVRPTTNRAKEGLFNILNNIIDFNSIDVLDLFSGTGSISFEFSSRGVKNVISIDKSFNCIKHIKKVSNELNLAITPIKSEVLSYLKKPKKKFNIIFADPPYEWNNENYVKMIKLIFENYWLVPGGKLIIEHDKKTIISSKIKSPFSKQYGDNVFSFYKKKQVDKPDSV